MAKRLPEELKDAVVFDYLSGLTTREIYKKHKTRELYKILKERDIEYKQNNNNQKEKYKKVIFLYNSGVKLKDIEKITGRKNIKSILKKFNIQRKRNPKDFVTSRKENRNKKLIAEYLDENLPVQTLAKKYNMTKNNIYRILKVYGVSKRRGLGHHWVIHQRRKEYPNTKCKLYILENYYGYTKIGITTKDMVKHRFNKNVNVVYEYEGTLKKCYELEVKLKNECKLHCPKNINRKIDGWSECYTLSPEEIILKIHTINV